MAVDTKHPEYEAMLGRWAKCRDAADGEEAIKDAGAFYLPILSGMEDEEYNAYKMRASFYNATQRTVKGLVGAVFRKPPDIKYPKVGLEAITNDIGIDGQSFAILAQEVVEEMLITGRVGILVDAEKNIQGAKITPYLSLYYAENIINWKVERVDGERVFTRIVLEEDYEDPNDQDDAYDHECTTLYRDLWLDLSGPTPIYRQTVWEEREQEAPAGGATQGGTSDEEKKVMGLVEGPTITPKKKGGGTFDRIPFIMLTPLGVGPKLCKSPILDLVNINISHYRTSADLEHGRHFTSLPTAWAAGFDLKLLVIGSARAWVTTEPTARCGYLEFSGEGLKSLSDALSQKERQMAVLGARLLEDNKKEAESADAMQFRHSGEQNTLSTVVSSASEGLTKCLEILADWAALNKKEASCQLNTDFNIAGISAGMVIALLQVVQSGYMSWDAFYYNLKRGEIFDPEWTKENEKDGIANSPVTLPGLVDIANPGGANKNANTAISAPKVPPAGTLRQEPISSNE